MHAGILYKNHGYILDNLINTYLVSVVVYMHLVHTFQQYGVSLLPCVFIYSCEICN
jgi:hypothetical protein